MTEAVPEPAAIAAEVVRVRQSGALGRSANLLTLFDYLAERAKEGKPPREIEIAQDVFGRASAAATDDGISRVYVHRLRQKLADHYRDARPGSLCLDVPRGEYRLVARRVSEAGAAPADTTPGGRIAILRWPGWGRIARRAGWFAGGAALALAVALPILDRPAPGEAAVAAARVSPIWLPLVANGRPTSLVEGDYYLFGQLADDLSVARLVRDFGINSRADLDQYLMRHQNEASLYGDVGMRYLPPSIAYAQFALTPLLAGAKELRVLPASVLTERMLFQTNIVFIGLTSGLGPVAAPQFAAARFVPGATWDELRDRTTGRAYVGETGMEGEGGPRRQYGLVSAFRGPQGNRFLVIAGTGDMALMGLSRVMADPAQLKALEALMRGGDGFEALFRIDGQNGMVAATRLIAGSPRGSARIWSPDTPPAELPQDLPVRTG